MNDPEVCIIVPGIGGSVLERDGRVLWDVSARHLARLLIHRRKHLADLNLEPSDHRRVTATRVVRGAVLIPGLWSYGGYSNLLEAAQRHYGVGRVYEFAYDWRRSNADSALGLATFIDRLRSHHGRSLRYVIVAHSMGGLVARKYLHDAGGDERCTMLITVGTPFRGAAKAALALVSGLPGLPAPIKQQASVVLRSFPSVYELLPRYAFLNRAGSAVSLRLEETTLLPVLTESEMFQTAKKFHDAMEDRDFWLTHSPPTLAIVSQSQPTITYCGLLGTSSDDARLVIPAILGIGDGTVPRGSAQPPEWREDVSRAHVINTTHVALAADRRSHLVLRSALAGRAFMALGPQRSPISVRCPELVDERDPVTVQVHCAVVGLLLDLTLTAMGRRDSVPLRRRMAYNKDMECYFTRLEGLRPGVHVLCIDGVVAGEPRSLTEYLTVVPASVSQVSRMG